MRGEQNTNTTRSARQEDRQQLTSPIPTMTTAYPSTDEYKPVREPAVGCSAGTEKRASSGMRHEEEDVVAQGRDGQRQGIAHKICRSVGSQASIGETITPS